MIAENEKVKVDGWVKSWCATVASYNFSKAVDNFRKKEQEGTLTELDIKEYEALVKMASKVLFMLFPSDYAN